MSNRKPPNIGRDVIARMLIPLANFAIQNGIGVREFQGMWRVAAVTEAARCQRVQNFRVNVARISASTGIPRSEISQILKSKNSKELVSRLAKPHSINRILTEWISNPAFTTKRGRPLELKIFGSGPTFESLVQANGGGLPVRAVLDELVRLGSAEITKAEKIKLLSSVPSNSTYSVREMRQLAEQTAQILEGMFYKMCSPSAELLVLDIEADVSIDTALPPFRKQVISGSEDFLSDLRESLFRSPKKKLLERCEPARHRVRVAVVYQEHPTAELIGIGARQRKNLRRTVR